MISRETAAKDMGYSGLTGRSLTVLAALAQYGLVERAGKGDVKVSRRAVDILHSVEETDRAEAIQEAAFAPALFQQLHERFPEGVPSQNALRSYLIQRDFGDVAIGPAITSFLETNAFVENAKESGSSGDAVSEGSESQAHAIKVDDAVHTHTAQPASSSNVASTVHSPMASGDLNKINMDIRGEQVHLNALLNLAGLDLLEQRIKALKLLLTPIHGPNDTGAVDEQPN